MQEITRLATPRFRRITIRLSFIEIELRTSRPAPMERPSPAERAYRRAQAEESMSRRKIAMATMWGLRP